MKDKTRLYKIIETLEDYQIEKLLRAAELEKNPLSAETKEFWQEYPELLEDIERCDYSYSDMGETDKPQF